MGDPLPDVAPPFAFDFAEIEARVVTHHLANGGTLNDLYGPPMNPADRGKRKARNFLKNYGTTGRIGGCKPITGDDL